MAKGDTFPSESRIFNDPVTGVDITQLTDHKAHSHHLYFTNPGWYDDGRRLLFGSDRGNGTNLYGMDLATKEFTQLTDIPDASVVESNLFQSTSVNPTRAEAYFWHGRDLIALDLTTLEERVLHTTPAGFMAGGQSNVSADGAYVFTGYNEDLGDRIRMDLGNGYVGFHEYWEAKPLSKVIRISTTDGSSDVVHEERSWVGHINTSPTRPDLLTFCHEGPWQKVDHRIWLLDLASGSVVKVRPTQPGERVGHEYWFTDGEHIGYHGWSTTDRGSAFHGAVRFDGTGQTEFPLGQESMHYHSVDLNLVVGDGMKQNPQLMVWRRRGDGFEGPRLLHRHRGSFHTQGVHVHPTVSPDGRQILFTADPRGYGNLHLVDIPDFDSLPEVEIR